ncbi:MAG: VPLPA-CTERM sorting domain-containing protein, partial [Pseudomonadota bacterium]
LKTFGSGQGSIVTSEQYQSELLFSLTYFPTLDYAFVNDIIISNREFQEVDVFEPYNPFSFNFNPIGTTGRYQTLGTVYGENRFTPGSSPLDGFTGLTINDGSPNTSPVPLPAAAWMLLAAVGGLFGLRRRSV